MDLPVGPITYQAAGVAFVVASVSVTIVMWAFSRFQTKREAQASNAHYKHLTEKLETDVEKISEGLAKLSEDVSYIRGRLEPRHK